MDAGYALPAVREPGELEGVHHLLAENVLLLVAAELEHPASKREYAPLGVADDEPRCRRRVVVVHELEEKAEAAVAAGHCLFGEALDSVEVDGALLAVGADEPGHPGDGSQAH